MVGGYSNDNEGRMSDDRNAFIGRIDLEAGGLFFRCSEMPTDTWEKLAAFTREELGRPLFGGELKIAPSSRLEEDLYVTGIDAIEFIDKWAETFGVQAGDFPCGRYFGPEEQDRVTTFLAMFSERYRKPPRVSLTLGMLEEAMRLGRWDSNAIEPAATLTAHTK